MNRIDLLMEFLASNKRWCTLEEISMSTNAPAKACSNIVHFLSNYNFVKTDGSSVMIRPEARKLYPSITTRTILISR